MKVKFKHWDCTLQIAKYGNNRTVLLLANEVDGGPITATVNIPGEELNDNEVIIKDWSENEGMVKSLQDAKIIGKELRQIPTGFVKAKVHELLLKIN